MDAEDRTKSFHASAQAFQSLISRAESCGSYRDSIAHLRAALPCESPSLIGPGFLRAMLRAKKYCQVHAACTLRNYMQFRFDVGWHEQTLDAADVKAELYSGTNMLLPGLDAYGHVVITQQMSRMLRHRGAVEGHQRAGYYLLHRALQRPNAQTRGIGLLLDFRGFALATLLSWQRADFKRGVAMLQDCFPARLSVIYVLHAPRWFGVVLAILRPLLLRRKNLEQKIMLLGDDYAQLQAHIPEAAALSSALTTPDETPSEECLADWHAQVDRWIEEEKTWAAASAVGAREPFDPRALLEDPVEEEPPRCFALQGHQAHNLEAAPACACGCVMHSAVEVGS